MNDGSATVTDLSIPIEDLRQMVRIRYFEEEVLRLRLANEIVGSVHLCNGQEAVYVGATGALDLSRDAVFPTYRGHGWAIGCGVPLDALFAELLGRESGTNGGRGGSAYLSSPDHGMYGENSIVGAGAPIAVGSAIAARFDGSGRVSLVAFGEGAMNQGAVHEAMNFAGAKKLPVIFLVENNTFAEMTVTESMIGIERLSDRATAYGFDGLQVDGNSPDAVRGAVRSAVSRARTGEGPALIEVMTQRIVGHYIGDVQHYRSKEDQERALADEPIARAIGELRSNGMSQEEIDRILAEISDEVRTASARALNSPIADITTVSEHLYA